MTKTYTSVEDYLAALKVALKGAPPGMVADALADCEEHLRGAIAAHPGRSEAEVFAEMARTYGTPEEVAAEYRAIEMPQPGPFAKTTGGAAPAASIPEPNWTMWNVASDPATYGALLYMLLSLATGVFYFCWATVGVSLSAGLFVLIVGIPFFLLFVGSVRLLSYMEGRIVETLLGVRMPRRLPAAIGPESFLQRIAAVLGDVRTWLSIFYMFLMLPLGICYFVLAVVGLATSGGLVFGGFFDLIGSNRYFHIDGGPDWVLGIVHNPVTAAVAVALGLVLFFLTLHLARAIGWRHGRIAEHLLVRL
jgi:hypothetical protein